MRALVIGSGAAAAEEVAAAGTCWDLVIAANCAAERHRADVQITLHANKFCRRKSAPWLVSHADIPGVDETLDYLWPGCANSGSSGLYAVKYALHRGADVVVVAGVGMNQEPHEYGGPPWRDAFKFRTTWERLAPQLRGRVFSLGGWTRELLGPPPPELLKPADAGFFMPGGAACAS